MGSLRRRAAIGCIRGAENLVGRYSLVGDKPFFEPDAFQWVPEIERSWEGIQAEAQQLLQSRRQIPNFQDVSPAQRGLTEDDQWKTFFFWGYGHQAVANCDLCPDTTRALSSIPGLTTAFFSILGPGKTIPRHRGPFKGVLRYHLGVDIPRGDCGIEVDGEARKWENGKSLVFDDTYQHSAWNRTNEQRIVLFVDFLRPLPYVPRAINVGAYRAMRQSPMVRDAVNRFSDGAVVDDAAANAVP